MRVQLVGLLALVTLPVRWGPCTAKLAEGYSGYSALTRRMSCTRHAGPGAPEFFAETSWVNA